VQHRECAYTSCSKPSCSWTSNRESLHASKMGLASERQDVTWEPCSLEGGQHSWQVGHPSSKLPTTSDHLDDCQHACTQCSISITRATIITWLQGSRLWPRVPQLPSLHEEWHQVVVQLLTSLNTLMCTLEGRRGIQTLKAHIIQDSDKITQA
jgi:hypothetical protein